MLQRTIKFLWCRQMRLKVRKFSNWELPKGHDTGIQVFNSATKTKVPLILKQPQYASWYICGPTVYDSAHIGHACTYVKFDIIRRILEDFFNINVVLAMNITDIDDKIIARAEKEKRDINELTRYYEAEFLEDMASLNVRLPTVLLRVSDCIPCIVAFVQQLLDQQHAYVGTDGSVYFDTSTCPTYGKLATLPTPDVSEVRGKRRAADFALWKASSGGASWAAPWASGRPGWHVECSAMASAVFGRDLDLHAGGADLKFPHHENEEAQCCSHHGVERWVKYWMHAGQLTVGGDVKMSKSLRNTVSVRDFLEKHTADDFRMFCLLTNYRNGVEFTTSTMENAVAVCRRFEAFLSHADAYVHGRCARADFDELALLQSVTATERAITDHLADDFDTSSSVATLLVLVATTQRATQPSERSGDASSDGTAAVAAAATLVSRTLRRFGVTLSHNQLASEESSRLGQVLDCLVEFRGDVRRTALEGKLPSLLQSCDTLRHRLSAAGITLNDHGKLSSWSFSGKQR